MLKKTQSVHVGHANVADDNPIEFARYMAYRFCPAEKGLNVKAGQFKRLNLRVEKVFIVINQNNPTRHFGIKLIRECHGCIFFNFTVNVAPLCELSTFSSPPRSRTMSWAITSPSPSPFSLVVVNGVKISLA